MKSLDLIPITEITRSTGVSPRMLRHYHAIGLVDAEVKGGVRWFRFDSIDRILDIRSLQSLGLSLNEIGILLRLNLRQSADFRIDLKQPSRAEVIEKLESIKNKSIKILRKYR